MKRSSKNKKRKAVSARFNEIDQQVKKAASRRSPNDKPSKGMRRFNVVVEVRVVQEASLPRVDNDSQADVRSRGFGPKGY